MPGTGASDYVINEASYSDILASVFGVFTGSGAYADRLYELPGFSNTSDVDELVSCNNEGSATIAGINTGKGVGRSISFDNCLDGSTVFSGDISTYQFLSYWVDADNFSIVGPASTEILSGSVNRVDGFWNISSIDYEYTSNKSYLHLKSDGFGWTRAFHSEIYFSHSISGEFTLTSDTVASGVVLSAKANNLNSGILSQQLQDTAEASGLTTSEILHNIYFDTGSMTVSAADGSGLLLDAATGDPATVAITLNQSRRNRIADIGPGDLEG